MVDLGVKIHELSQQLETTTKEVDFEDFKFYTSVSWAYVFEYAKRKFNKVYPDLALPLYNLLDYNNVEIKYGEYNDSSDIEWAETSSRVIMNTYFDAKNETQP